MAEPLLPQEVTEENLKLIRSILVSLTLADPKDENIQEIAAEVWSWAENTAHVPSAEILRIQAEPENRPYLELAEAIAHRIYQEKQHLDSPSERMQRFQEEQQKRDSDNKRQALAEETKKGREPSKTEQLIRDSLRQIGANARQSDPESTTEAVLEAAQEPLVTAVLDHTVKTTETLADITESTNQTKDIPQIISPMADVLHELVPEFSAANDAILHELQKVSPTAPIPVLEKIGKEIVVAKIVDKLQETLDSVPLKFEAEGYPAGDLTGVQRQIDNLTIDESFEQAVIKTLAYEFETQANLSPQDAQELAVKLQQSHTMNLAYTLASLPQKDDSSPEAKHERMGRDFTKISQEAARFYRPNLVQRNFEHVNFGRVLTLYQDVNYQAPPVYDTKDYEEPDQNTHNVSRPNEFVRYIESQGKGYLQDQFSTAWKSYLGGSGGTATGTVVAETAVGAAIAPASTALVATGPMFALLLNDASLPAFAIAVQTAVAEGSLVLAGTLATGEAMYVTPAALSAAITFLNASGGTVAAGASTALVTAGATAPAALAGQAAIPIPVLGAIAGIVLLNLPKIYNFLKDNIGSILGSLGGLAFGGAFLGVLGAAGGAALGWQVGSFVASAASGGVTGTLQTLSQGATHVLASLAEFTVVEIATPILVTIVSIPIVVVLLLFIINNSAYVVPPSVGILASSQPIQSQYITVTKDADVTAVPNSQLPKKVTYRITVSAPKGALTNISFNNSCQVLKKGTIPPCNHPTPSTVPPTIDSDTPFSFEYSQTYDSSFTDSLVSDSFSVTADSPEGRATSIASASVSIGTPPTQCFDVAGTNWPANYKANVLTAIGTLTSNYAAYSAKVCHGGPLQIIYDTTKNPGGWGYYSGGTIYLNGGGLSTQINALYIVAHESGHHLAGAAMPALYKQYLDTPGMAGEIPLCSYVNTTEFSEAFAESIALYVTHDQSSQWLNRCSGTFATKYPNHWNFDDSVIFK